MADGDKEELMRRALTLLASGQERGRVLAKIGDLDEALCRLYNEALDDSSLLDLFRAWAGAAATVGATGPKTILVYDPYEVPDTYHKAFKDERKFENWLGRMNASGLFKYGQPPAIDEFDELEEGALYTVAASRIPARVGSLEKHKEHLVWQREEELASAVIDDLAGEGAQAEKIAEERVVKGGEGDVAEVDVAVRYTDASGQMGFVLGSMKTHVGGDSDVSSLQKKVEQHFAQRAPFCGHPIQLAFMAETVKAGQWDKLRAACKAKGVRLYARNGKGISRVQLMSSRLSICMC